MTKQAYEIATKLNSMLHQKRFDEVDGLLRGLDIEKLTTTQLVSYLASSRLAKDKLPYRQQFYKKVEQTLRNQGRLEKGLLDNLE